MGVSEPVDPQPNRDRAMRSSRPSTIAVSVYVSAPGMSASPMLSSTARVSPAR